MQNQESKLKTVSLIEKVSVAILGFLFIVFPILFTNLTTDVFALAKQTLLIFSVIAIMLLFGIKTLVLEKVRIRKSQFDFAILLFLGALLLSSIFSVARIDSFINLIPVLFAGFTYFAIVFNIKNKNQLFSLFGCLVAGASISSLITIFSYFRIYVFPLDFTKFQAFTTIGTNLDQAIYLFLTLITGLYILYPYALKAYKKEVVDENKNFAMSKIAGFSIGSLIIVIGLILTVVQLLTTQKPVFLPLETGFQTAFAAISQDAGRILQGLLFGNGFGEYFIAFSKFKQASLNTNPTLWNIQFIKSSNLVLELLATTGIAGLLSFFYLCYKVVREKPFAIPLIIALATCFILPLSFIDLALIFFLLGLFATQNILHSHGHKYYDVDLQLVALKNGFITFSTEDNKESNYGRILSYFIFAVIVAITGFIGYLTYDYLNTNMIFQKSLVAASKNNGSQTYQYEASALNTLTGKYVDSYYRVFSQTNLALANSVSSSIPQGSSPSAQLQQNVVTLVQQSITSAKQATTISPQNAINWQNLSGIYRTLIGFGQNADSFAVLAQQQAVQLDPTNPQQYISLGGIYYQLGLWDKAIEQFQIAINMKSDYPNAYYNIGHALQQKGDLKNALAAYQAVRNLIANDPANVKKIDEEIAALQTQLNNNKNNQTTQATIPTPPTVENPPLNVATPEATLPTQKKPIKIPAPKGIATPTPQAESTPPATAITPSL
jgi:tetratricopeptide (TPR) repeat protein